ncbi:MAG: histidine kinase [Variovorax sp.]
MREGYYPASLALVPLAVWAALRFGLRGATLLTLVMSAAAIAGTVHGFGPFVDHAEAASLLRWWLFANIITVTTLVLAASRAERDRAQAQAIKDRDFAAAVLDAEGALVVVLDPQWRIERVNRALEAATGFAAESLKGRRFEEALVPQEQWHKIEGLADLLRLKLSEAVRHDSSLRRQKRPPLVVSWSVSALRNDGNAIEHVIVSGLDVSARVEAAEALRHARRTLEARVAERTSQLARANAELQLEIAERRRLEGEIIHVSENEKMRFGQELHDGLGQHLTATAFQAALLARDLEGQQTAPVAERIETMLGDAISQTRLLARGLFPVELEDNGLSAALAQLAANARDFMGMSCELHCPEPVDVQDHTVAIHLYRIAQEAVNNAAKHARCQHVAITLARGDRALVLRITDDGADDGAGDRVAKAGDGMGLGIMRYRARLIGADIELGRSTSGGKGWEVKVVMPEAKA